MSGECDKCGEHPLNCSCPRYTPGEKDKFFYQGRFFEREEDFWAYVRDFTIRKTSAQDFNGLFDMLKKDVWMNLMMHKPESTNSDVRNLLDQAFIFFIKKLCETK